jgi:hypothetical protein
MRMLAPRGLCDTRDGAPVLGCVWVLSTPLDAQERVGGGKSPIWRLDSGVALCVDQIWPCSGDLCSVMARAWSVLAVVTAVCAAAVLLCPWGMCLPVLRPHIIHYQHYVLENWAAS